MKVRPKRACDAGGTSTGEIARSTRNTNCDAATRAPRFLLLQIAVSVNDTSIAVVAAAWLRCSCRG